MMHGFTYRDLLAWQRAMALVEAVYQATGMFPRTEAYGLTGQLRRAAVSIPGNLAEGHSRGSTRSFAFHVSVAQGSLVERETCLELAERVGVLSSAAHQDLKPLVISVGQLLTKLRIALRHKIQASANPLEHQVPEHSSPKHDP